MKEVRFFKIVVILLIVVNLGTLSFMWLNKPPNPPLFHGKGPIPLSEVLQLQGNVKLKVDKLEVEHHKMKRELLNKDRQLHAELISNIGKSEKVEHLHDSIDEIKSNIDKMTFAFFNEVATYCNDQQKNELRNIVEGAFNHVKPPHPNKLE